MVWISPDGNTKYTQGPDCDSGPNCCCGKCSFATLATDCNNSVCCKCVPKYLCAVHYPYTEDADCISTATDMVFGGYWIGDLPGLDPTGVDNAIQVDFHKDTYDNCYFRVIIPGREIDDLYLIEGGKRECSLYPEFRMTCRDPYFVYEDFELNGCMGRLVIQRKMLAKVPFHADVHSNIPESTITDGGSNTCGTCTEWCRALCLEFSTGGLPQKTTFRIQTGGYNTSWSALLPDESTATITAIEGEDGICYFHIDHSVLGFFDPVPIPYQMCNLGMIIEQDGVPSTDSANKWISLSCNKCSCWDYICEQCRCVCQTMCIVSVDGPEQTDITYYELEWDQNLLRWGDETKWVGIHANQETGKCEYVISGWNDEGSDAELIDSEVSDILVGECGKDMSYYVSIDPEEAFATLNFKFEYGVCKTCLPDCFRAPCADCCTECESKVLPEILYIDLFGGFTAGGEDPGEAAANCLTVTDIPLVHTAPLFAELQRWQGSVIVDCGCPLDPLTPDPSPNSTKIDVVLMCVGGNEFQLGVSMKGRTSSTSGGSSASTSNPFETTSFTCTPFTWTGIFISPPTPGFDGGEDNCCCPLSHEFTFAISE